MTADRPAEITKAVTRLWSSARARRSLHMQRDVTAVREYIESLEANS